MKMMTKRCPKELTYPKSELVLEEVGNKEAVVVHLDPFQLEYETMIVETPWMTAL